MAWSNREEEGLRRKGAAPGTPEIAEKARNVAFSVVVAKGQASGRDVLRFSRLQQYDANNATE